jgi:hypothetical protein
MVKAMTQRQNISANHTSKFSPWRSRVHRFLAVAVGLVLLIAGLLKAIDLELFIRQIKDYGIIHHRLVLVVSAWGLIILECGLGVALIILYRPGVTLPLSGLLFLVFAGATGYAWLTGATEHCGCYGPWLQFTPGHALVENLIFLTATAISWKGQHYVQASQTPTKAWAVTIACLCGLVLPMAFGIPTLSINRVQSNEPLIGPIQIHGSEDLDLNQGVYLIVLMGTDCLHCQEAVPDLNMLAERPDLPPIIALCTSEEADCIEFVEEFQPIFPIGHISEDLFWRLLADGDMPRTILLENGRIKRVWDKMVPDENAVWAAQALVEP